MRLKRPTGVQIIGLLVSVSLLAVPLAFGVRWWPSAVAKQAASPTVDIPEVQLAEFRKEATASNSGPVILTYHDIAKDPSPDDRYTVSTENFATQMRMLREAGYTSLSSDELIAYTKGAPIPPRSVVITFDDSTRGMWTQADPVLAANGFRALCFVITGSVGKKQPYYLRWDEMHAMQASGRWDLEAHTHNGHHRIKVGAEGRTAPFLTNRKVLKSGTLETAQEWQDRVTADLDANIAAFAEHQLPKPSIFAYPFSAATSTTNDSASAINLDTLIKQRFAVSVVNDDGAGMVAPRDVTLHTLPRVEVYQQTSTEVLFNRISTLDLSTVGTAQLAESARWMTATNETANAEWFHDGLIEMQVPTHKTEWLTFAPGATSGWSDYRADLDVTNLVAKNGAALEVLSGSDAALRVTVDRSHANVDRGRNGIPLVVDEPIRTVSKHHLAIVVRDLEIAVLVDNEEIYRGPTNPTANSPAPRGGIAVGIVQQSDSERSPLLSGLSVRPASTS